MSAGPSVFMIRRRREVALGACPHSSPPWWGPSTRAASLVTHPPRSGASRAAHSPCQTSYRFVVNLQGRVQKPSWGWGGWSTCSLYPPPWIRPLTKRHVNERHRSFSINMKYFTGLIYTRSNMPYLERLHQCRTYIDLLLNLFYHE